MLRSENSSFPSQRTKLTTQSLFTRLGTTFARLPNSVRTVVPFEELNAIELGLVVVADDGDARPLTFAPRHATPDAHIEVVTHLSRKSSLVLAQCTAEPFVYRPSDCKQACTYTWIHTRSHAHTRAGRIRHAVRKGSEFVNDPNSSNKTARNRQTDRQTNRQTDRQTDRHTHTHTHTS